MRTSLRDVMNVIKSNGVPEKIIQQPFDYDPGHYQRLCNVKNRTPNNSDLIDYALDMKYVALQPDLLRHLTPVLLTAWRRDLFEGDAAGYGGFVENFWPALLKGDALRKVFTGKEREVFARYIRDSILDRLECEDSLHFSGMRASPYRWVQALVCYGVLFSDIEILWTEWWNNDTQGHAIAAFQYTSALMYEAEKNPVFTPWTSDKGGGAPALWECGCFMFDVGWTEENLSFLRRTLSVNYFKERLLMALGKIHTEPAKEIARRVIDDLPRQETLLALRIEELPKLLTNVSGIDGFTI
jgi:hypothetical protein